jgi:hypothetical protein
VSRSFCPRANIAPKSTILDVLWENGFD